MIKRVSVFAVVLVLLVGGMGMLASEGKPVAHAAPRLQETTTPRPTPTDEPQFTDTPEPPTDTPGGPTDTPPPPPTNTPVPPTDTPVPPTRAPRPTSKPTSKPKPPKEPAKTSVPEPPAPTPTAALDRIPTTGFGSIGGWTLGVTGLVLVCILVVVRRLRTRKTSEEGNHDTAVQSSGRRHPPK
jgi:outer membrane biosynthesis protein TonB